MNSETEKPIIVRYGDSKRPVKIPYDIEAKDSYDASCRLNTPDNDLVFKILCKLQDGLKVTAHDATEALKQYRRFQGEIGRLQCTINRPCRYPSMTSSLYMQEKSFKDRTQKIIECKEKEIVELKQKLAEKTLRLQALLAVHDSNVTENKDKTMEDFSPAHLAEQFRDIYDKEWKCALEELTVVMERDIALAYLAKITRSAFEFSTDISEQQLAGLMKMEAEIIRVLRKPVYDQKERRKPLRAEGGAVTKAERDITLQLLKDFRRVLSRTAVSGVTRIFLTLMSRLPPVKGGRLSDDLRRYILRVAEITYMMCVQEPPIYLEWVGFGETVDKEKYRPYTVEGTKVVGTVWPAVLRHEGGPVMSRGVVDATFDLNSTPTFASNDDRIMF